MVRLALCLGSAPENGVEALARILQNPQALGLSALHITGNLDALMHAASQQQITLPQEGVTYHDCPAAGNDLEKALRLVANNEVDILAVLHDGNSPDQAENALAYLAAAAKTRLAATETSTDCLWLHKNARLFALTRDEDIVAALSQTGAVAKPIKGLIRFLRHTLKIDEPNIALLNTPLEKGSVEKFIKPVIHAVNGIGASRLDGVFAPDIFAQGFDAEKTNYDVVIVPHKTIAAPLFGGEAPLGLASGLPVSCFLTDSRAMDQHLKELIVLANKLPK